MASSPSIFDAEIPLPDARLGRKEKTLLGFDARYDRVHKQLQLLLRLDDLPGWSKRHYGKKVIPLCDLMDEQYPLAVFYGDVGTGKTATAECVANRIVREANAEDSILFKLSNSVRGSGKVGEMGTLLVDAFKRVNTSAGRSRRAILIIDEGDSLGASRNQEHSHHEDKVAVNTLIQGIDGLRQHGGRVLVILCTNRFSVIDAALQRRAAITEKFERPSDEERRQLFAIDLEGLQLKAAEVEELVRLTGEQNGGLRWTYSDVRTRLYPAAMASAFPDRPIAFDDLRDAARRLSATPVMEDRS